MTRPVASVIIQTVEVSSTNTSQSVDRTGEGHPVGRARVNAGVEDADAPERDGAVDDVVDLTQDELGERQARGRRVGAAGGLVVAVLGALIITTVNRGYIFRVQVDVGGVVVHVAAMIVMAKEMELMMTRQTCGPRGQPGRRTR